MNRNSTPEANTPSSLRLPASRTSVGASHHLRASADMAALAGSSSSSRIRPSSDFYGQQGQAGGDADPQDKMTEQWITDIEKYENTLEEMAAATLDQDFKDELSAIEQWFRVLSEAERTAALYALLQQTTQVQIRFFVQILQQMDKKNPVSGVLSPSNTEKDTMSNRLSDAMTRLSVSSTRNSISQQPGKRLSGLDASAINAMFPDAAAAIAMEKAKFAQQTGNQPPSNRNSAATDIRNSLAGPTIAEETNGQHPSSPWGEAVTRPKSSTDQGSMGQFMQPPPPSAGVPRSPRPMESNGNIQSTSILLPDRMTAAPSILSPYNPNGNWASMVNTPMNANFATNHQADMLANATAMKMAALHTLTNRESDLRKNRRARSNEPGHPLTPGVPPGTAVPVLMYNEHGQPQTISRELLAAYQTQQNMGGFVAHRSRPNSPGHAMQGAVGFNPLSYVTPSNGYLNPHDGGLMPIMSNGLGMNHGISMAQFGLGPEGYVSDHSDINRGRSPRGRRGVSKAPEDPTDMALLQDIPAWLRALRLHKYTDNLKDMKWTELIELDDKALENRGVNALGARRKMLKAFESVKEAKTEGKLG